jgi:PD-(D/E)XK endonuclease
MARHHTKDKGDLGVAKVHADLACEGFTVLFPATEPAPFDLVAYADEISSAAGEVPVCTLGCRHCEVSVDVGGPRRYALDANG